MKKYEIEIKEFLSRVVEVKAKNEEEAFKMVTKMYDNEEIVLNDSDYIYSEINKVKSVEDSSES